MSYQLKKKSFERKNRKRSKNDARNVHVINKEQQQIQLRSLDIHVIEHVWLSLLRFAFTLHVMIYIFCVSFFFVPRLYQYDLQYACCMHMGWMAEDGGLKPITE